MVCLVASGGKSNQSSPMGISSLACGFRKDGMEHTGRSAVAVRLVGLALVQPILQLGSW